MEKRVRNCKFSINENNGFDQRHQYNKKTLTHRFLSASKRARQTWLIFFILALSISIFMIYRSCRDYYKYEVISKIRVFNEIPMLFPTVTICNMNRDGLDVLPENELIQQSNHLNENSTMPIIDILIKCKFVVENDCKYDWIPYFDYAYGQCYRFNSGFDEYGNPIPIKKVQKPGGLIGLYLELFVGKNQNENNPYSGFRVLINNNTVLPSFHEGILAQPGTLTKIGISRIFRKKLEKPYSDCQDLTNFNSKLYNTFIESNLSYRQTDCFDLCIQTMIIKKCKCFSVKYSIISKDNYKPCLNQQQNDCVNLIFKNLTESDINSKCSIDCPMECEEVSYEHTISTVEFPSKIYAKFIKTRYLKNYFDLKELDYETIREHVLALDINYEDLKYTIITESPYKTFANLVGDIGGTCSVFLGLSLFGSVRILEFCLELIVKKCKFIKNDK